jgi:hypothetical protein
VHGLNIKEVVRSLETGKGAVAPPPPVGGIVAESRANRVERDVTVRFEEISIVGDMSRRESAGEEMSAAVVLPVEPLGILAKEAPHPD